MDSRNVSKSFEFLPKVRRLDHSVKNTLPKDGDHQRPGPIRPLRATSALQTSPLTTSQARHTLTRPSPDTFRNNCGQRRGRRHPASLVRPAISRPRPPLISPSSGGESNDDQSSAAVWPDPTFLWRRHHRGSSSRGGGHEWTPWHSTVRTGSSRSPMTTGRPLRRCRTCSGCGLPVRRPASLTGVTTPRTVSVSSVRSSARRDVDRRPHRHAAHLTQMEKPAASKGRGRRGAREQSAGMAGLRWWAGGHRVCEGSLRWRVRYTVRPRDGEQRGEIGDDFVAGGVHTP